jgi:hypothetical protein
MIQAEGCLVSHEVGQNHMEEHCEEEEEEVEENPKMSQK